jgi:hypothetical protein
MSNYRLSKGRDGWKAESSIPLEAPYALRITTSKGSRGLSTSASRVKVEADLGTGFTGFSFMMFQDFSKTVAENRAARCTENTVRLLHEEALAKLDQIKADCAAFYAAKGA